MGSGTSRLADAIGMTVVKVGSSTPAVRGGDWQLATVTVVGVDGTVTAGGIPARRHRAYVDPAVGDLVVLMNNSAGDWIALGKQAPADGTDGWQAPTLTTPWINYVGAGGYTPSRYRRYPDGDVSLEGVVASNAVSVGPTSNLFTLPVGFRPPAIVVAPVLTTGNAVRQLEVSAAGLVRLTGLPTAAVSYVTIGCRFSTL